MAIRTGHSRVLVSIAAVATGILLASGLGARASDPSKVSAGPFGTTDVDPGTVTKNTCTTPGAPAPGVKAGDHVVVGAPFDLEGGLVGTVLTPVAGDLLEFRICNPTLADVVAGKKSWNYMVVR
jgi:hypothetical protein